MEKTAATLTPEEIAVYRAGWAKRAKRDRTLLKDRYERAWKVARLGADLLRKQFGVEKVWVFGSLLHPERFHSRSDIDLAVESIDGTELYRAVSLLLDVDPEFSFDLVELIHAREHLRRAVEAEGQEL